MVQNYITKKENNLYKNNEKPVLEIQNKISILSNYVLITHYSLLQFYIRKSELNNHKFEVFAEYIVCLLTFPLLRRMIEN